MNNFKFFGSGKTGNSHITLEENAKIAVIGGGPSGSFFSIFALKMAKMVDKKIDLTIFEPKSFSKEGPAGCNRCTFFTPCMVMCILKALPPKIE
jgi:hypothetical protein